MSKVATKRVKLVCGEKSAEVDALVTTAGEVSAMSDRLATNLTLTQQERIQVNSCMNGTGYIPSAATQVIIAYRVESDENHVTIPVAFLIIPDYQHELVLGADWLSNVCETSGACMIFSCKDPEDLNITRKGKWISIGSGYPTPGPGFMPNIESLCHLVGISMKDKALLKALEQAL